MKDSEAACATLGMNLVGTKLAVFAFSAAIAGVGGALYGGLLGSINGENFSFINGLQNILLVTPGLIGISLGRNPSGAMPQIREAYRPVRESKPVLVGIAIAYAA